eukprot:3873573-Pleurochrysis_carterae.AAC.1
MSAARVGSARRYYRIPKQQSSSSNPGRANKARGARNTIVRRESCARAQDVRRPLPCLFQSHSS